MLLNLTQTAEKLGLTPESVKRLVEGGALSRVPYGNADSNKRPAYRFNEADVQNFRRARSAANTAAANGSANGAAPSATTATAATILGDDCIALPDAAAILGWKRQRVYDQIKAGNLIGRKVGRHMMLPRTELDKAKLLPKTGLRQPLIGRGSVSGGGAGMGSGGGVTAPIGSTTMYPPAPPNMPVTVMSQGFYNVHARLDVIERKIEALVVSIDTLLKVWS